MLGGSPIQNPGNFLLQVQHNIDKLMMVLLAAIVSRNKWNQEPGAVIATTLDELRGVSRRLFVKAGTFVFRMVNDYPIPNGEGAALQFNDVMNFNMVAGLDEQTARLQNGIISQNWWNHPANNNWQQRNDEPFRTLNQSNSWQELTLLPNYIALNWLTNWYTHPSNPEDGHNPVFPHCDVQLCLLLPEEITILQQRRTTFYTNPLRTHFHDCQGPHPN